MIQHFAVMAKILQQAFQISSGADLARFLLLRIYTHKAVMAIKKAMVSESGRLAHTPSMPKKPGRMSKEGMRKMSWRESERKIDTLALPIDWKKLDITICPPIRGNAMQDMRNPLDAKSMSVASVVKRRTTGGGMSGAITKPKDVTNVPATRPYTSVRCTRAVCLAP